MSEQLILGSAFGGGGRKECSAKGKVKLWRKQYKDRLRELYECVLLMFPVYPSKITTCNLGNEYLQK